MSIPKILISGKKIITTSQIKYDLKNDVNEKKNIYVQFIILQDALMIVWKKKTIDNYKHISCTNIL